MFPPGYFPPDYFAPGYWADVGAAAVPGQMAATITAGATLTATGEALAGTFDQMAAIITAGAGLVATGELTSRSVEVPSFGNGGRFEVQRRVLPRSAPLFPAIHADGAAVLAGRSEMRADARGVIRCGAALRGGSGMEGTAAARVNFAQRDNDFWLLAA